MKQGRKVLFSGTPCQIAGLKRYLRKEYDNLLTVDVICHGVPSPKVWRKYIKEIKGNALQGENTDSSPIISSLSKRDTRLQDNDLKITGITFRDKRLGWEKYSFTLNLTESSVDSKKKDVEFSQVFTENPYMKLYLNNLMLWPQIPHLIVLLQNLRKEKIVLIFWIPQTIVLMALLRFYYDLLYLFG